MRGDAASGGVRAERGGGPTPLVSVVTVVFNAADALEATVRSVAALRSELVEFVVVDGASTDGTVDVLRRHAAQVDHWISEPDGGVYDAFNKAVRCAAGEWILFLGAGDELAGAAGFGAALQALRAAAPQVQLAYGRIVLTTAQGRFVEEENEPWAAMRDRWQGGRKAMPHHQAIFQRRPFLAAHPFDVRYRIVADYKVFMSAVAVSPPLYIDAVISRVSIGGLSTDPDKALAAVREILELNRELGLGTANLAHQYFFLAKCWVKTVLAVVLPRRMVGRVIDAYRVATGRAKKWT